MKRLYILRHSKAGQTTKKLISDHSRCLTDKGISLCQKVAENLNKYEHGPEFILSSTSLRTMETAQIVKDSMGLKEVELSASSQLYLASMGDIVSIINDADDKYDSIMLVGHNPTLQQFCLNLPNTGDKKIFRSMRNNFPPASYAVFDCDIDSWKNLSLRSCELVDFVVTK